MKLRNIFAVIAAAVTVTAFAAGCSDSPSDVVENFISDVQNGDIMKYETFEKYLEKKHHKELKKTFQNPASRDEIIRELARTLDGRKVVDEKIDGEKATVTVKDKNGITHDVIMIKEDGVWKVKDL